MQSCDGGLGEVGMETGIVYLCWLRSLLNARVASFLLLLFQTIIVWGKNFLDKKVKNEEINLNNFRTGVSQ